MYKELHIWVEIWLGESYVQITPSQMGQDRHATQREKWKAMETFTQLGTT